MTNTEPALYPYPTDVPNYTQDERVALLARDICPDCDYHVNFCKCEDEDY